MLPETPPLSRLIVRVNVVAKPFPSVNPPLTVIVGFFTVLVGVGVGDGGTRVGVRGTGVAVGRTRVGVGGTGVGVGGEGVSVGTGDGDSEVWALGEGEEVPPGVTVGVLPGSGNGSWPDVARSRFTALRSSASVSMAAGSAPLARA